MNSEVAYWTLSTIAIVTVTLMGFMLVALVFYVEGSIRQKQIGKLPLGKSSGMVFFSVLMLGIGAWVAYSGITTIHDLPDPSTELNEGLSRQVDSTLVNFRGFIEVAVIYASFFIVAGAWDLIKTSRTTSKGRDIESQNEEGSSLSPEKTIGRVTRLGTGETAVKCRNCGQGNPQNSEVCSSCGKEIPSPGERAQALATLIQSQDSISWVAFSLAMTLESVLLVGFYELNSDIKALGWTGLALAIAFLILVVRSNRDMSKYYSRAAEDYPDIFNIEPSSKGRDGLMKRLQQMVDRFVFKRFKARYAMIIVLLAWIGGWLRLLEVL